MQEFKIPHSPYNPSSVAILFIDTVLLAGLTHPKIRSHSPGGPASLQVAEEQWSFINETLASWTEDQMAVGRWRIVVGHYPGNNQLEDYK